MRVKRARGTLALTLLFVPVLLVAGAVSGTPLALGAPAPSQATDQEPEQSPSPTPSPTPEPTPTPTPEPEPEPEPSPSPSPSDTQRPSPSPAASGSQTAKGSASSVDGSTRRMKGSRATARIKEAEEGPVIWWDIGPSFSGGYSTSELMSLEQHAAQLGASDAARRKIYAPFIIAGPAEFSDTWGSVRHNEGDSLRPHLGQDVFCDSGTEVLAAEGGRVELATDRLGGTIVRLHRAEGGYWYYAHLLGYAPGLRSGDTVKTGDVIGYCGATGNAGGGAPHVHFGSYPGPENPMGDLIGWLEEAEAQARRATKQRAEKSVGLGTVVWVYDEDLVQPCLRSAPIAETDPLDLLLATET